jgi:hypothetical protein
LVLAGKMMSWTVVWRPIIVNPKIKVELAREPYHEMPFLNAAGGRRREAVRERLPFIRGKVTGLP